jgi:hypothetical protein
MRIRNNRERALQLQKLRQEKEKDRQSFKGDSNNDKKRKKISTDLIVEEGSSKSSTGKSHKKTNYSETPVEPCDVTGVSEWVTKKEAMNMYCLPEGTLAVCECKEQDNPHNKSWAPMKLFRRVEIRQRAHARYGGPDGLAKEKSRRSERQFFKEFGEVKNLFR